MNAGTGGEDYRDTAKVVPIERRVATNGCDLRWKYADERWLCLIYTDQQAFIGQFRHCNLMSVSTGGTDGHGHPTAVDQRIDEQRFTTAEEQITVGNLIGRYVIK